MKTVCLFSIHRTGTNYLLSVLRQWPSLAAFGELFHPDQVWNLKPVHWRAIAKVSGHPFEQGDDPAFIAWARRHPEQLVEALRRVVRRQEREGLWFKVFVGQWQRPVADVVAALAREPGFLPVVLQRRPLDVYVSFRKAEAAGAYKHVDTTARPEVLDPDAYARWADDARRWYREVDEALAAQGVSPVRMRYETDVDLPPEALCARWSDALGLAAPDVATLDAGAVLARQDRSASLADKIANHDEFLAALDARGLGDEARRGFGTGESLAGRPVAAT